MKNTSGASREKHFELNIENTHTHTHTGITMCKGCVFHFIYMQSMSWRANVSAVSCVYKHKFRKCNSSKGTTQLCTILQRRASSGICAAIGFNF